jgi:uncharacterized protein YjbJ (UPF0337 family)
MGTFKNKVEELRGRFKKNAGQATGDRRWEAEGKGHQIKGSLEQAGEKIRDAFKK